MTSIFNDDVVKDSDTFEQKVLVPALSMDNVQVTQFSWNTYDVVADLGQPVGNDIHGNPTSYVDVRIQVFDFGSFKVGYVTGAFPIGGPRSGGT